MRFHGIYQHDVRDCGVACLATISEYYGLKVPLSYIRDLEKVNMNGSSIYGICEAAKILGLDAEAYQGSIQELLEEVNDTKEICTPFIVHTVKDGLFHFVVVKKINSHFVWIFDPDKGNLKMKIESFTEIWTGYIISFQITSQFRNGNLKKGTYERYLFLLRNHKKEFIWLFLLSLLITGITVMCTLIFQHIVDHFMVHSNTELMRMVNVVFAIIIVLYIIRLGIYIIRGIVGARISRDIEKKLLDDFLGDLLKVSVNYYDSRTNGEVLERLNDIEHIKETLCSTVLNLTLDFITAVVSGIIIFIKSPVLFMITCVIMLISGLGESLERALLLIKEDDKKIPLIMQNEGMLLKLSLKSKIGALEEAVMANNNGESVRLGINPRYLLDIIKVIDNDEIAFGLSKPKAPVLISGEGYKYIVLPVNIPA